MEQGSLQVRETYVHQKDLLLLHFFLWSRKNNTTNLSDGGSDTETSLESRAPGGHGTDPNDSLVKQTYVRSHMPTNISYTVNVKMWKICTFGKLKNIPVGVFGGSVVVRYIVKKRGKKHQDSILGSLFPWPRLWLHIKDCASHQTQTTEGGSGRVHGYEPPCHYTGTHMSFRGRI